MADLPRITISAPRGVVVDRHPDTTVVFREAAAAEGPAPPDPDDPFVVYLREAADVFSVPTQERVSSTARTAAAMRRNLEVDLEVAGIVTLEQLDALQTIARRAGVDEVIVYVQRRR